ncbi:MAG: hypothetical protein PVI88_00005 [Nitrosopumilaceae archaeon]|jgi:hypothetical protein
MKGYWRNNKIDEIWPGYSDDYDNPECKEKAFNNMLSKDKEDGVHPCLNCQENLKTFECPNDFTFLSEMEKQGQDMEDKGLSWCHYCKQYMEPDEIRYSTLCPIHPERPEEEWEDL